MFNFISYTFTKDFSTFTNCLLRITINYNIENIVMLQIVQKYQRNV